MHPPNKLLFPILSSNTKILLYTQNECGKCLSYQPLEDLDMEGQELRKTIKDCVENCGYDNLQLSRVMSRVFYLKSTHFIMWVMRVYIVWVKTWCSRYVKIAKQNISRIFRENVLPTKYSRNPNCHDFSHSSHVLCTWLTSWKGLLVKPTSSSIMS